MVRRGVAAILALAASLSSCSRTVDEEQCKKLLDKMVELLAAENASTEHVDKVKSSVKADKHAAALHKETCVGRITKSQYECMMSAQSLAKFAACDK